MINIRDNREGGVLTETTLPILLVVYQPNHGYGIMQFTERKTSGRVVLGVGTLYGATNTLVKKKRIALFDNEVDSKRKEYPIAGIRKQRAEEELQHIEEVWKLISTMIKGDRGK